MSDLFEPSNAQAWALILGVLSPLLTAVVQQPGWSKRLRVVVAVVVALAVGFLNVVANGQLQVDRALTSIALTLVASQAAYQALWKQAGVTQKVEAKTSRSRAAHRA